MKSDLFNTATRAEFVAANPILSEGEIGYEVDTKSTKIGNGIDPYNSLGYAARWNANQTSLVNPATGADVSLGGGSRTPYLGAVAGGKMCTWGTAGSVVGWITQRLRETLYEDVKELYFVFSINYGAGETASAGTADIQYSVDKLDGSRVGLTFGGSTTGVIPTTGLLVSDKVALGETQLRGQTLWHNGLIKYNSTGVNGHHRNSNSVWLDAGETSGFAAPASPPTNNVMSGAVAGNSGYCLRPIAILGMTTRDTFIIIGDSMNCEDFSYPYISDGRNKAGLVNRKLSEEFACINVSQSTQNYQHTLAVRSQLAPYITAVVDELGVNNPSLTLANFKSYMSAVKAQFPNKAYGHTTFYPRTNSTDFWTTTVNQTPHASNLTHPVMNQSIRNLVAPLDFMIDTSLGLHSTRDSNVWTPNPASFGTVNVTALTSTTKTVTAVSGAPFTYDKLGTHMAVFDGVSTYAAGLIISVAANFQSCVVSGTLTVISAAPCYLNVIVQDGLHLGIDGEFLTSSKGDWRQLAKFKS